ncbi:MAG: NB-ARC domain-containing protein [Lachnospiraceae bacterium]|nr:NB-ARC domain-containing protein [Lachnospiraceae bacterium]
MRGEKDQEQALLEWRWHQLHLRRKYRDTAAGFSDPESERQAFRQWKEDVKEFKDSREYRILSEYQLAEEIFVGRDEYLAQVETALDSDSGPVILYGIAGIGKSAIARAYVRRVHARYDHILFLSCDAGLQNMICDDYHVTISNLKYSRKQYGNRKRYFQIKCEALIRIAKEKRLLLVIDGFNEPFDRDMEKLLTVPCDILITTRLHPSVWGIGKNGIHVEELKTEEEWEQFTENYRNRELSSEDREKLLQYWKKVQGHTWKMIFRIRWLGSPEEVSTDFEEDLFRRFPLKKEEQQALMYLSVMPVQGIPKRLFLKISQIPESAVNRLVGFLLVRSIRNEQWKDELLSLHPVVAEAAVKVFSPSPINCSRLLKGMEQYLLREAAKENDIGKRTYLEPYVFSLLKAFPEPVPWLASAFYELVTFLCIQGYYLEAEEYSLHIFHAVESYYGEIHQTTGEMAFKTSDVYFCGLKFPSAQRWYLKGLAIMENCGVSSRKYWYMRAVINVRAAAVYRHIGNTELAMIHADAALKYIGNYKQESVSDNGETEVLRELCMMENVKINLLDVITKTLLI